MRILLFTALISVLATQALATVPTLEQPIAILRALGAGRFMLFGVIVTEAAVIGALGMIAAFAVYFGITSGVAAVIHAQTGVLLTVTAYNPVMLWAPLGMVVLCAFCGLLPAWKAYQTDVAGNLSPVS